MEQTVPMKLKTILNLSIISILVLIAHSVFAHGMSEGEKHAIVAGGYAQFIQLGATHMLTGYDHLLFVLGFVFFLTTFKDVVKYVTVFTIGHSITLIFATLMGITPNYYLIDAVIALSVCYIGYENIGGFKNYFEKPPNLLWAVFLFGFIHGFGLSTRLQQLPLGDHGIVMKILSFNLGIEIGQIVALCIMVALLFSWRKSISFLKISEVSNRGIIAAGALLFLMQMHGYLHNTNPKEFGYPEDDHFHAHEDIDSQSSDLLGNEYTVEP
jgi:hypothetical protein